MYPYRHSTGNNIDRNDLSQFIVLLFLLLFLLLKYTNDSSSNYVNISEIQNTFL